MLKSAELAVWLYGTQVGVIGVGARGLLSFSPHGSWTSGDMMPRLGAAFLRDGERFGSEVRLPSWFEHLLPPFRSPLRRRVCAMANVSEQDSASLLSLLGHDLPGAVVVDGRDIEFEAAELELGPFLFSVPGMQPKLSLLWQDQKFIFPAKRNVDGDWYVKMALDSESLVELPQIENATMEWARCVGLEVPQCELVDISILPSLPRDFAQAATSAFAVKRFDRVDGQRVHQEDFAQALGEGPFDIYGGLRGRVDYSGVSRLVRDLCGERSLHEFVRRLAFVVASGNTDAHLKNWSFQWWRDAARPTLSPVYDQVSTVSLAGVTDEKGGELALGIGGVSFFEELGREHLKKFCVDSGDATLLDTFDEGTTEALRTWDQVEHLAPESMRRAVAEHWERTPLLSHFGSS
ncbi:MAG: type II toxin-antitoxin system HipA family toxin [Myxococcota bacterium]